ncbi:SDR family oxidoreductase [Streptomyces hoynatensis]|uniref:SDR family oxidoreductase n=1 Tax=Streptomyces hoynatensis TaxID=1141874 RepID=A0A3A9YWR6_9ACTN|nr:SDR family oxidoreductase [Streptomyces hoynatensis]RKN40405.1 SDR family oxidoreductase [Streptomyces hoynatensis]
MPVSLVIGGTSGVGLATARQLLARGDDVHLAGRDAARLDAALAEVPGATGHRLDAQDAEAVRALVASLAPLDRLVLTLSGRQGLGALAELDLGDLRRAFDGKFWAHLTAVQAALPHLAEAASVTLVSAITARVALPGTAGVASLNAAVEGLVKPLAAELAPIRVNAVSPGYVDTPWWTMAGEERDAAFAGFAAGLPTRRIATADDVAEAVVFAATNPNLTGTVIESDGGVGLVA